MTKGSLGNGARQAPAFIKPEKVIGRNLVLRNANIEDAEFILRIRTQKSQHLSKTAADLGSQAAWLARYANDDAQVYFVIENKSGTKLGTVRLYDQKGDSFCWGSWILSEGSPSNFAVESALMVYRFAIELGFRESHFDVRKANESVCRFHERFGARRVEETDLDYFYCISMDAIELSLEKYKKYLPNGIEVVPSKSP